MPASISGQVCCAGATVIVGASVAVTSLLQSYPIYGGQAARYLVAAMILTAILLARRPPRVAVSFGDAVRLVLLAAVGLVIFNVAMIHATRHATPSLIGALLGTAPIVLAVAGPLVERSRIRLGLVLSAVVVTAGIVIVEGGGAASAIGLVLAVVVLACEIGFSLLAVPLLPKLGALRLSTYLCWLAVPQLVIIGLLQPGPLLARPSPTELTALVLLALLLTTVAFLLWYAGLRQLGPARAGLWVGLMPIAALVSSVLLGREALTWPAVVGAAVITIGITVGLLTGRRPVPAQLEPRVTSAVRVSPSRV